MANIPAALPEMLRDSDKAKAARAMRAMLGMKKLDIAELRAGEMIRKRSDSRYRDLQKITTGHIGQHRARLPNGARASGAWGVSGVVTLSPILWLSNR